MEIKIRDLETRLENLRDDRSGMVARETGWLPSNENV